MENCYTINKSLSDILELKEFDLLMTGINNVITNLLPLRQPTYLILLSLAPGKKHGYAILKDVEELSQGSVILSTGTLYEGLARLLDQELIERTGEDDADAGSVLEDKIHRGKPRKAYRLTALGRKVLEAETNRMRALVAAANKRLRTEPRT